jgi:hypothetical protein
MNIVFKTGLYNEAVREWNKKPAAQKTYALFQEHFIEAQEQYQEEHANMKQAGFGANVLVEQVQNLANLVVANDGTANSKLDKIMAQYAEMKKENEQLRAMFLNNNNNNNTGGRPTTSVRPPATDQGSYCWSHGYKCHRNHNSFNCNNPKPGHVKESTRENNMGGSQRGKPSA